MNLAGRYAYAGRPYVIDQVLGILGASSTYEVHNHHNFAWKEVHDGKEVIVVRKGAAPLALGQQGFIGGSIGDIAVIVEGIESDLARDAFYSTIHGAGRIMSRTQAAGKMNGKPASEPVEKFRKEQMEEAVKAFGVELRGGGTDGPFCLPQACGSVGSARGNI